MGNRDTPAERIWPYLAVLVVGGILVTLLIVKMSMADYQPPLRCTRVPRSHQRDFIEGRALTDAVAVPNYRWVATDGKGSLWVLVGNETHRPVQDAFLVFPLNQQARTVSSAGTKGNVARFTAGLDPDGREASAALACAHRKN